jgi:hypothetical protein
MPGQFCYSLHHYEKDLMAELPDLLTGAIALEYVDTVRAAWLAAENPYEKPKVEPTHDHQHCTTRHPACPGLSLPGQLCTACDESCSGGAHACSCDGEEKKGAGFQPAVAGWLTPPALPLH